MDELKWRGPQSADTRCRPLTTSLFIRNNSMANAILLPIYSKCCSFCKNTKEISCFSSNLAYKDGYRGQCKECRKLLSRAYSQSELGKSRKAKATPDATRRYKLKAKYSLTEKQFGDILAKQGGRCAVCRTEDAGGRWGVFHVDHCHSTGQVRGVLCHNCNLTLGRMGDDLNSLYRFTRYLECANGTSENTTG